MHGTAGVDGERSRRNTRVIGCVDDYECVAVAKGKVERLQLPSGILDGLLGCHAALRSAVLDQALYALGRVRRLDQILRHVGLLEAADYSAQRIERPERQKD